MTLLKEILKETDDEVNTLVAEIKKYKDKIKKVYFDVDVGNGRTESGYGTTMVDDGYGNTFINIDKRGKRVNLNNRSRNELKTILKQLKAA